MLMITYISIHSQALNFNHNLTHCTVPVSRLISTRSKSDSDDPDRHRCTPVGIPLLQFLQSIEIRVEDEKKNAARGRTRGTCFGIKLKCNY